MTTKLDVFVFGCDNPQSLSIVDPVPWIEAGTQLSGVLCLHESVSFKEPDQKLVATTDIQIESTYDCHFVIQWTDWQGNHQEVHETHPEVYNTVTLQYGFNVLTQQEAQRFSTDPTKTWILFWFDLPNDLCQSTTPNPDPKKENSLKNLFAGYIRHTLSIRISIPELNITTDWNARDVLVLRARPVIRSGDVPRMEVVDKYKHARLEVCPDGLAYMEGDMAGLLAHMDFTDESTSKRHFEFAKLTLTAVSDTVRFRFTSPFGFYMPVSFFRKKDAHHFWNNAYREKRIKKEKILECDLRGVHLMPGVNQTRSYVVGFLPTLLEYPSMMMTHGEHQKTIQYMLQLHLDKMGIHNDIKVEVPLDVYPSLTSRQTIASMDPATYIPQLLPSTYRGAGLRQFQLKVLRAEGIPKMSGLMSKPDPYCTILINGVHFRNTKIEKKTLDPQWMDVFIFYFPEQEHCRGANLVLECYDYNVMTKDTMLGVASASLSSEDVELGKVYPLSLDLVHEDAKKKAEVKAGIVVIEYIWR